MAVQLDLSSLDKSGKGESGYRGAGLRHQKANARPEVQHHLRIIASVDDHGKSFGRLRFMPLRLGRNISDFLLTR